MTIDFSAELSFTNMVQEHFTPVSFAANKLLRTAQKENNHRLLVVAKQLLEKEDLVLRELGSKQLMDFLYATDNLFTIEDAEGNEILVAVDVTTNYLEVGKKLNKFNSRENMGVKSMLQAIGVKACIVVVWEKDKTYAQMTKPEQYAFASVVLDHIDEQLAAAKWATELILV